MKNFKPREANKKPRESKKADFGTPEGIQKFRGCTRKTQYPSERIAQRAIESSTTRTDVPLYHYRCRECKNWHLTHVKQSVIK